LTSERTVNERTGKAHKGIITILALYLVLGVTYSLVTPVFEASDELWHYPMVKYIADNWSLPVQDPEHVGPWKQEGSQPPLYYALGALLTAWIDTSDMAQVRRLNPHVDNGVVTPDGNINLVVHDPARESFPWRGTVLAVHLIRFMSVLMGAGTVYLTYRIALEVWPERKRLALAAAAITAFNPMFLFISGSVNNDNLAMLLCALALWMLMRVGRLEDWEVGRSEGWKIGRLGVVLGLAVLTKESALGLLLLTALVVTYAAWQRQSWRVFFTGGAITAGLVALIAGWWYYRNWVLYGDPLGLNAFIAILGKRAVPADLTQLWAERKGFMMAYWGLFGGVNVPLPEWIYVVLNTMAVLAGIGLILKASYELGVRNYAAHNTQRATRNTQYVIRNSQLLTRLLLFLWPLLVVISWVRWASVTWSSQGRLVFSAIAAWSVLMAWGLDSFAHTLTTFLQRLLPHWKAATFQPSNLPTFQLSNLPTLQLSNLPTFQFLCTGLFLLLVATYAPFGVIAPAYRPPAPLTPAQLSAIPHPLDVTFGGRMRLLGYDLARREARPGETLEVILYWQAVAPMQRDWSTFVHLLDENDLVVAQRDMYPGQGLLPTSQWQVGEAIANRYVMRIPLTAYTPSQTRLEVGLYDYRTCDSRGACERLPLPDGTDSLRFEEIALLPRADSPYPNPVSFNFADKIELIGYRMDRRVLHPGDTLHLTLYWRCLAPMERDYTVFTHVLGENNSIWGQQDSQPQGGQAPTSTWQPGQVIEDTYELVINPQTPPAVYDVEIGWYYWETLERLPLVSEEGQLQQDWVLLSKVRVVEK